MTASALSAVAIPRSHEWEVAHPAGDRLRAMLAWPAPPPAPGGYPVFCVLDAGTTFGTATETARLQAGRPAATGVRPAVILGLDLATRDPAARQRLYAHGAAALLRLLETTVLPQAAETVPLDHGDMALFGHSLAGLVPLHALFEGASSFSRLVAASPSLWWNDEALLQRARGFAASAPAAAPPLLLTVGGLERADRLPAGTEPARVERVASRRMAENVHALAGILSPAMAVEVIEFPGENHGSSLPGALARAVAFALGSSTAP